MLGEGGEDPVRSKRPPCLDSKRPRVCMQHAHTYFNMCACCPYTREHHTCHNHDHAHNHTQHRQHTQHATEAKRKEEERSREKVKEKKEKKEKKEEKEKINRSEKDQEIKRK